MNNNTNKTVEYMKYMDKCLIGWMIGWWVRQGFNKMYMCLGCKFINYYND